MVCCCLDWELVGSPSVSSPPSSRSTSSGWLLLEAPPAPDSRTTRPLAWAALLWSFARFAGDPPSSSAFDFDDEEVLLHAMPIQQWSKRYYRQSVTQGQELWLVKRKTGNVWVCLTPQLQLGTINVAAKTTISTDPTPGVVWQPAALLSEDQKIAYLAQATSALASKSIPALPLYRPGQGAHDAIAIQLGYALFGSPQSVLSSLRWALRKPRRVAGLLASLFVAYQLLVVIGFVDYLVALWVAAVTAVTAARDTVVASSEAAALWYEWA